MVILSTGQKIKKLRKEMGLTQDKLTNNELTRSLISMIENDRRNLSWSTAEIIAEALNKYYRVVGTEISPEYLLESEAQQVKRNMREEIDKLQIDIKIGTVEEKTLEVSFCNLISIAKKWEVENELMELYLLRANFFVENHKYNKGLKDYFNVMEYYIGSKDYNKMAQVYNLIGKCYFNQGMMDHGLIYYQKAYETLEEHVPNLNETKLETLFYMSSSYYECKNYEVAFDYIDQFKELLEVHKINNIMEKELYPQVILMEANIYRDLKKFSKAETMYTDLVEMEGISSSMLLKIYENCAALYREWGNLDKSFQYINIACQLIESHAGLQASHLLPNILLSQSKGLYKLRKNHEAIKYLKLGLALAKQVYKKETIVDIYFILVQIYISIKDHTNALEHLREVEELVLKENIHSKVNDLYSFYAEIYDGLNDRRKSIEYISRVRQDYLAL